MTESVNDSCFVCCSCLQLGSAETYKILGQGGCVTLDGVDDAKQFRGVRKAFDTIGMGKDTQMQVRSTTLRPSSVSSQQR